MSTKVMAVPQLTDGSACDEKALRFLPINNPIYLKRERWCFVYQAKDYNKACGIVNCLQKACGRLGTKVEDPYWIEMTDCNKIWELK